MVLRIGTWAPVWRGNGASARERAARRLRQEGEISSFRPGEFVQRLIPITLCRGRDAIGSTTEIDLIEVELQDLVFGERAFDANGEDRFFKFALDGDVTRQAKILGNLLSDGRLKAVKTPTGLRIPASAVAVLLRRGGYMQKGTLAKRMRASPAN